MRILRSISLAAALLSASCAVAQADTQTRIFDPNFKTLKVQVDGNFMAQPVVSLSGPDRLCVSFDEMGGERSYLRYSLLHCDADWQPSSLLESEVLDSFNEAEADDFGYSAGVFRNYINYRICLPNEQMRPLLSGNYLLRVYREDDPDSPVLQARFSVCEDLVRVTGAASSLTDRGTNDRWQQVSMEINTGNYQINDPYNELIVKVQQNGVDVTPARPLRPLRTAPGLLIYEHNNDLIFPAGNEFRRFETVRTDFDGMHVADNRYEGDGYTAILTEDAERASRPYTFDRTQFGRYKVDEYSATDPDLGADYVNTVFTLDYPKITNGDVVLDGEFVRALPESERTMRYDPSTGKYSTALLLKQGSYNYRYGARLRGREARPDFSLIEGDHYVTQNDCTVNVYHRPHGARYDRLIGSTIIYTEK